MCTKIKINIYINRRAHTSSPWKRKRCGGGGGGESWQGRVNINRK